MTDVIGFIKKAAEKSGFDRERYDDKKVPTDVGRITVVPFFGDLRSLYVLSRLLLKRFRDEDRGSRYFVFCSWPGFQGLFPYVDEYWGVQDESVLNKFYAGACQFRNKSGISSSYYRNLNQYFFEDVVPAEDYFKTYYDNGLTDAFWDKYRHVKRTLPAVPSSAILGKEFNRELASRGGFKVFVYPSRFLSRWQFGDVSQSLVGKEFWVSLVRRLISEGFVPVVYKGLFTHDISADFTDKCVYLAETDFSKVLAGMRASGCVLDFFTGMSRYALAARCPFLSVDEHPRWVALKEYEVDDLCGPSLPRQYIFSFPTNIEGRQEAWDSNVLSSVMARLHSFLPMLDRDQWPPTGESTEVVPYEAVRRRKSNRIGARLLKVPKD